MRKFAGTYQAQEVSAGKKDCVGCWTPDHICYGLAESLSVFCLCPETLPETEIKGGRLINLAKEISRQSNVEAVAWLLLGAFSQIYVENQEQTAQQNDSKCCEFEHKGSTSKVVACKDGMKERLVAEETSKEKLGISKDERKDGPRASQETAGLQPLQPRSWKGERLCFEKNAPEHHVPEWRRPKEVVPRDLVQSTQQSRHMTTTEKQEGSLVSAPAGGRPWRHPRGPGFKFVQNARVVGSGRLPPRFQRKAWEARQCAPERAVCEAVKVKPKVHWRPQKFGEARNVDRLRKTASREQNQPKREAMGAATTRSAVGAEPPKPLQIQTSPQIAAHGTTGINVFPAGFQNCLGPVPLYPPICTLWDGNAYLVPLYVGSV